MERYPRRVCFGEAQLAHFTVSSKVNSLMWWCERDITPIALFIIMLHILSVLQTSFNFDALCSPVT